MDPLYLTAILSFLRYVYLECGLHDKLCGKYFNGYVAMTLLALALRMPIHLILFILVGRTIYRKIVGPKVYNNGNHIFNILIFFIGIYICFLLKSS